MDRTTVEPSPQSPSEAPFPVVAEISRRIVRIYASHHGRGPTKARTVWREAMVTCLLGDVFTRAESVLVEGGRFGQVRSNRLAMSDTVEPLLRATLEEATGERVLSVLSQVSKDGVASEVFLLDR